MIYSPFKTDKENILRRFSFRQVDVEGFEKMRVIRKKLRELVVEIDRLCPNKSTQESIYWALESIMDNFNRAISEGYPVDEEL